MENVFLKLLNMSITAGWLILAVIVLRFLLRKAPKWICCLLWAMVAFRLVCPISLESIFSMVPSRETIRHDAVISTNPTIDSGVVFVDNVVNPVIRESLAPAPGASVNPLQVGLFIAGIVWSVGVCIMLAYAGVSYLRLRYRVRTAVRFRENIYISEYIDTPFILGVIRPRIYLSMGMEEATLEPVMSHEQAHIKRRDYFWKPLGYVLLAVYWFHPLCWFAYSLFCKDIELACDEKVIKNYDSHQKKTYSEALLSCSMNRSTLAVCPLAFGEVGVKERIKSVLHYKKPAFWLIVAAVIVCVPAAVCFLTDPVKEEDEHGEIMGTDMGEVSGTEPEEIVEPDSDSRAAGEITDVELLLSEWTKAFVNRDGDTIASLASEEVIADLESQDLLSGRSFGLSSPWPMDVAQDALVYGFDDEHAEIYYYAWTSEPHVTVWKENISYEIRDGKYTVTEEEIIWFDNISSAEELSDSLMGGAINGTRMDYRSNGAGKALNDNALLSSTMLYRDLLEPEGAAIALLNLSGDSEEVKIGRLWTESMTDPFMDLSGDLQEDYAWNEDNVVALEITFLKDNQSIRVNMLQLYGKDGIWIPNNYEVNPIYRFLQLDWEDVKKKKVSLDDYNWWTGVVCIGEIPEKNITLYGYNDEECSGRGVAIEIGDDVNYFDWYYVSPRSIGPECYWNEEDRQLQVALNIYTGTGFDAQEMHVLQYYDTGTLADNALDFDALSELLYGRIESKYDEDTRQLTLIDSGSGKELAAVEMDEGVDGRLELGNISHFILGDTITLQVELGWYYSEGVFIAEYEGMPTLETEVLLQSSEGGIIFELGEIKVIE